MTLKSSMIDDHADHGNKLPYLQRDVISLPTVEHKMNAGTSARGAVDIGPGLSSMKAQAAKAAMHDTISKSWPTGLPPRRRARINTAFRFKLNGEVKPQLVKDAVLNIM